jgi:hypothetical protein
MLELLGVLRFSAHDIQCVLFAISSDSSMELRKAISVPPNQVPPDDLQRLKKHRWYKRGKKVLEKADLVYSQPCREGCLAGTCRYERQRLQRTFKLISPAIKILDRQSMYVRNTNTYTPAQYKWVALVKKGDLLKDTPVG